MNIPSVQRICADSSAVGLLEEGASLANKLEPGFGTRAPAPKLCKADQRLHRDVRVAGCQRTRSRLNEQRFGANDVRPNGAPHAHAGVRRRGILRYLWLLTNDLLVERVGALVLIVKVGESGASEQHSAIVRIASSDRVPLALKSRFGGRLHRALGSANDAPRVSGRRRRRGQCERKKQWQHDMELSRGGVWRQGRRAGGLASSGCSNGLFIARAHAVARSTLLSTRAGTSCRCPSTTRTSSPSVARTWRKSVTRCDGRVGVARRAGRVVPIAHRDRRGVRFPASASQSPRDDSPGIPMAASRRWCGSA